MRVSLVAVVAIASLACTALAGNYIITIDGKRYEVDLDKRFTVALQDGKTVQVALEKKDIAAFSAGVFSFSHPSHVAPARTDLGDGVHQTMMVTPSGTMVMIQEYSGINPSGLVDFMLTELLKESVQYGYKITKTPASKKLADGRTVTGKRAVSKYQADVYDLFVLCYGTRDAGIMIITQIEKAAPREDVAMIDMFWKSMRISIR